MSVLQTLFDAEIHIGSKPILWREIIGNGFGIASAIGGTRRVVWAWPVGIAGNALLFTVFMGAIFHTPQDLNLYGQAGRQVLFILVSAYGWSRWYISRSHHGQAVMPHWAGWRVRAWLVVAMVVGTLVFAQLFGAIGSYGKYPEAWIFMGSVLATYGMARGWTEFWLIWIAVDLVGVPQLISAGFYPSAVLYAVYAGFVIWGFWVWLRVQRREASAVAPV